MDTQTLLVRLADGAIHSGESLAAEAGLTRAAVWKTVRKLERWGLQIEAISGRGYRLAQPIELLDAAALSTRIGAEERFPLEHVDVLVEVDSTNRYLARHPPSRAGALRVCIAEWQSAGRGRLERRWVSPLGSGVCLSASWVYEGVPQKLSALSLAAGVAAAHSIREECGVGTQLKWPNDILWNGRKLGGVLVESSIESHGRCTVVIGVGLNVAMPRRLLAQVSDWHDGAADLVTACDGRTPDRNALAARLACELGAVLAQFARDGAAQWLRRWQALDYLKGRDVCVGPQAAAVEGVAAGIDAEGALRVRLGSGEIRTVVAGDASVRRR